MYKYMSSLCDGSLLVAATIFELLALLCKTSQNENNVSDAVHSLFQYPDNTRPPSAQALALLLPQASLRL